MSPFAWRSVTAAFATWSGWKKAAEMLLGAWPEQNGPAYANAKEALAKALQDPSSDSARAAARMAFAAAADEAGILRE